MIIVMLDQGDRRLFQPPSEKTFGMDRTGRADAEFAISKLGDKAAKLVLAAPLMHFGQWLGWPDELFEGTSLTETGSLPAKISLADALIFVGNVIDRDDSFALVERLLFSQRPVLGTTWVLALLHAPNLGLVMQVLVRAMVAQNPFLIVHYHEEEETSQITFEPAWSMGPLFRFVAIGAIALVYRAVESIEAGNPAEMALATQLHDVPKAQSLLARFRCRIEPAKEMETLRWPKHWSLVANPYHDPLMWSMAQAKMLEIEYDTGDPEIIHKVRGFIVDMLQNEQRVPRIKQVAAHLGISIRSVVRQLARNDMSFHRLVEDERKARAIAVIADPSISLAEAAQRLGFGDVSTFGRWVKKCFGDTPNNLRKSRSSRAAMHR
ncbi:helix-turn-helix transcriptional regulator [Erythrobacter sp. WG]|uniref:helix-turn-helix transcriptional regulator n=1 Tax=Erythrobacter sp. WG TaxID=2985510 RepID=UPI00226DEDB3|nr:AraC family transcriptional regulator [Erythrobacter sp. WG]MCX9147452.1 AraC family transcriptional regulator [Erythrobacter sp. WG]